MAIQGALIRRNLTEQTAVAPREGLSTFKKKKKKKLKVVDRML